MSDPGELGRASSAEAAAFVGLFVPGETAMIFAGFLAYRGQVDLVAMAAVAAAGAVVGDSVGYEIGRRFGPALMASRLGRRVGEHRWDRAAAQLAAKGGRAVFFGRFASVLRALVPTLAGMGGMPYRRFLAWNVAGGLIWAPGCVLLGFSAGSSFERVAQTTGGVTAVLTVAVLIALMLATMLNRRVAGRRTGPHRRRAVGRSVRRSVGRPWAAFALGGSVLACLALWTSGSGAPPGLDAAALRFAVSHRSDAATSFWRAVTDAGSLPGLLVTALVVAGCVALRRRSASPLIVAVGATVAVHFTASALKLVVGRQRPPEEMAVLVKSTLAFPSGHAATSAVAYAILSYLVTRELGSTRARTLTAAVAAVAALAVGWSRVYLGVHWLTDVVAGWALAVAWLALLVIVGRGTRQRAPSAAQNDGVPFPAETRFWSS